VGARSVGSIPPSQLIEVVKTAAQTGAQVFRFPLLHCYFTLICYSLRFRYASSL